MIIAYSVIKNPMIGPAPISMLWAAVLGIATICAVAEQDFAAAASIKLTKVDECVQRPQ